MICLDTNAVIAVLNPKRLPIRDRLEKAISQRTTVAIPAIVLFELWYGIKKSARPEKNAAALAEFLTLNLIAWPFESEDAEQAGEIRVTLRRAGTPIGPYDVLIAAQARRRGAVLITANEREFTRVPGLKTEDWTRA
jgi:tRNA(fMet)-specific endonuclease VapC